MRRAGAPVQQTSMRSRMDEGASEMQSETESRQVLEEWNDDHATGYPRDMTIHALFEEQAADATRRPWRSSSRIES